LQSFQFYKIGAVDGSKPPTDQDFFTDLFGLDFFKESNIFSSFWVGLSLGKVCIEDQEVGIKGPFVSWSFSSTLPPFVEGGINGELLI